MLRQEKMALLGGFQGVLVRKNFDQEQQRKKNLDFDYRCCMEWPVDWANLPAASSIEASSTGANVVLAAASFNLAREVSALSICHVY